MSSAALGIENRPVASNRKTAVLCGIVLFVAAASLYNQLATSGAAAAMPSPSAQMLLYTSLIVAELLLFRFVYRNLKSAGTSLVALVSQRALTLRAIGIDILLGSAYSTSIGVASWPCK